MSLYNIGAAGTVTSKPPLSQPTDNKPVQSDEAGKPTVGPSKFFKISGVHEYCRQSIISISELKWFFDASILCLPLITLVIFENAVTRYNFADAQAKSAEHKPEDTEVLPAGNLLLRSQTISH